MKLYKNRKGFDWQIVAYSNETEDERGKPKACYLDFHFKKGTEPVNTQIIEGDLFFREQDGTERKVFFTCYQSKKDGTMVPKFVLLDPNEDPKEDVSMFGGEKSQSGQSINIEPNDLPFF